MELALFYGIYKVKMVPLVLKCLLGKFPDIDIDTASLWGICVIWWLQHCYSGKIFNYVVFLYLWTFQDVQGKLSENILGTCVARYFPFMLKYEFNIVVSIQ